MGRPKTLTGPKRPGFTSFAMSEELIHKVECLCFLLGMNKSEVIRFALEELVSKHKLQIENLTKLKTNRSKE